MKKMFYLILVFGLSCCVQKPHSDNEKAMMSTLESFYSNYIKEISKWPPNIKVTDVLNTNNCSNTFLKKYKYKEYYHDIFLCTQDIGDQWSKTMKITRDTTSIDLYVISFYDENVIPKEHIIKIKMVFENSQHKIDEVICVNY